MELEIGAIIRHTNNIKANNNLPKGGGGNNRFILLFNVLALPQAVDANRSFRRSLRCCLLENEK